MYGDLCLPVCLCTRCVLGAVKVRTVCKSGTGVIDGLELPCEHWGLNLGPLEEQSGFLTQSYLSSSKLKKKLLLCVCVCVCARLCVHGCRCHDIHGDQRTTLRVWLSPIFTWVSGLELKLSGLHTKHPHLLSHLAFKG